jgi:cell fate regulator YaaT (PSP1 superfamily)
VAFIIGIMFKKNDNVHYFDPAGIKIEVGDKVICHIEEALEIGEVSVPMVEIKEQDITAPLNKIVRKATYYDLSVNELNRTKEKEGYDKFGELTKKYKLSMKLVNVHRQIGVRDEAKIVGGLGPCGRDLCCKSFLTDFESISIKMAKDQNLPLNPLKISGICGRLMCCLRYEHDSYQEFVDNAPERGRKVKSCHGCGVVCGYEPLKESLVVYLENKTRKSIPFAEVEVTNERVELDEFGEPSNMDYVKMQEMAEVTTTGKSTGNGDTQDGKNTYKDKPKEMAGRDSSNKVKAEKESSGTKAGKDETGKSKTGKQDSMRSAVNDSTDKKDIKKPAGKAGNDK